ncbi:MAG: DUF6263 family protein [Bacteroidales bacterium]|jgi:hypothetical protein|nr:DUF6263 family protein [Bacteroidales bacterium]
MNHFLSKIILLTITITTLFSACSNNEKYTLEYHLSKGDVFKQQMTMDMLLTQKMQGQEIKISTLMTMDIHYDVTDVQDDIYMMDMKFDGIKMDMDMGVMKMSFDSNTTETTATANNLSPMFKAIVGQSFQMTVNKKGKIQSISGFENMITAMISALDGGMDESTKQQIVAQFGQQFSDEKMKSMFEQISAYFPENQVAIGESWQADMMVNNNQFNMNANMNMKLKEVKDQVAIVEIHGTISTPEGGISQQVQGMESNITMSGKQEGIVKIDMKTGFPVSNEITQDINGETSIMGMKIPMSIISKITTKEVK